MGENSFKKLSVATAQVVYVTSPSNCGLPLSLLISSIMQSLGVSEDIASCALVREGAPVVDSRLWYSNFCVVEVESDSLISIGSVSHFQLHAPVDNIINMKSTVSSEFVTLFINSSYSPI